MLEVNDGYKAAITATRRKVYGKVIIDYSDPFLDASVSIAVNESANISYPNQVADGKESPVNKWVSLDGAWVLDGSYALPADTEDKARILQMGWWGSKFADSTGLFNTPYPMLTVKFFSRKISFLKLIGDSMRGEYPVDFKISLYDPSDTLLYLENITGNTQVKWSKNINIVANVVKMTLQIIKWSHPGRQAKIIDFFTAVQEIYEGDDVFLLSLLEEREINNGSLPIGNISANEIDLKLYNRDRKFDAENINSKLYGLVRPNRRIRPFLGILEGTEKAWFPLGTFWSADWDVPENDLYAATSGRDRLDLLMRSTYTSALFKNITLKTLAENILSDAGLIATEYWIDPELEEYIIPYAWLEQVSHREALRRVAESCCGQVYADRNGIIRVEGASFLEKQKATSQLIITDEHYFYKSNPANYSELANCIEINTQPLKPVAVAEEIYKSSDPEIITAGQAKTLTVFYSKKPALEINLSLQNAPTNAVITNKKIYAWGAEVTVSSAISGTFNLLITGKPLEVQGSQMIVARDEASVQENGLLKYCFPENDFIQSTSMAQKIANKCLALSKDPRRNLELDWRGNPALELGDRITISGGNRSNADFWITSQNIEWDGTLSAKLNGKKVL